MVSRNFDANRFIGSWRQYSSTSSLNGLYIIGGLTKISKLNRIVCFLFFLVVCDYCIYLWYDAIAEYQNFPLKTSITYNYKKELQFPAISIISPNQVKFDNVSDISYVGEAQALHYSETLADAKNKMKKMYEYCTKSKINANTITSTQVSKIKPETTTFLEKTTTVTYWDDYLAAIFKTMTPSKITNKNQSLHTFDSNEFFKLFGFDSSSVVHCTWASKKVPCQDVFYNHIDDILVINDFSLRFSFNQHPNAFLTTDNSILKSERLGYGMNYTDFNLKMVTRAGKDFGLRIIMHVDDGNYCGISENIYTGAGYKISIHDPKTIPNVDVRESLFLSAGYIYNIEIRPQTYDLRTEFLGRCTTQPSDIMKILNITHYTQQKCTYLCAVVSILSTCKCRMGIEDEYITEKLSGLSHLPKCIDLIYLNNSVFACLKDIQRSMGSNFLTHCPECKRPCLETKYSYSICKTLLFPSLKLGDLLYDAHKIKRNRVEFTRENTFFVNFYFPEMIEITIIEDLKTDELDLFLNLAGTIGLLMGASVMTIYEVLHQIVFSIFDSLTKRIKRVKNGPLTIHIARRVNVVGF